MRCVLLAAVLAACVASSLACCCPTAPKAGGNGPAPAPVVTRANYDRITNGMHLDDVEKILGKGREFSSTRHILIMTWEEDGTVVSITFEIFGNGPHVRSKTILGD